MTGATEVRHMNPPKRPPEVHDEPEPEYESEGLPAVYRGILAAVVGLFVLVAVGAVLAAVLN